MNLLFKENLMPTRSNGNGERLLACPVCGDVYVRVTRASHEFLDLACEQGHIWQYGFHFHKGETAITLDAHDGSPAPNVTLPWRNSPS